MGIPEDHKTAIVSNGLHFLRSITECYGTEKGLELWEQIASILDPDVKGQIFFAMVTGTYNDRIELRGVTPGGMHNAVPCIKAIREHSGLGLKDAKDMYDRLKNQMDNIYGERKSEFIRVSHEQYSQAMTSLRNAGMMV